jgi:hypothetical protein
MVGTGLGTGIGAKPALLGRGAAGPVFLHVGTTFVEPIVAGYEPTEGATTDPYPEVPACASAAVLERAKAVANATVSFIVVSLFAQRTTAPSFRRSLNSSLSAIEAAKLFTSRRVSTLQQPPSIACHSI